MTAASRTGAGVDNRRRNRAVQATLGLLACGVLAGCNSGAAPSAATSSVSGPATTASSTAPAATPMAVPTPPAVLLATETLRADEAGVISPALKAAARAARDGQAAVGKALSAYVGQLSSVGCSASTAGYGSALAGFRSAVAKYQQQLATAAKFEQRLQADADAVTAAAKKAGISVPVDLSAIKKSFAGYQADAANRATAIGTFETRGQTAHGRCLYKLEHPRRH